MHSTITLTEFEKKKEKESLKVSQCLKISQHYYLKKIVMTHVNVGNEFFHMLEGANEAHRPSFAT